MNYEMSHCFKILIKAGIEDNASGVHDNASDAWDLRITGQGFSHETREEIMKFGTQVCKTIYTSAWAVNDQLTMS